MGGGTIRVLRKSFSQDLIFELNPGVTRAKGWHEGDPWKRKRKIQRELGIRSSEDGLMKGKRRVLEADRPGLKPQVSHLLAR